MPKRIITDKRREAARINGAKSRGPKTPEGKARVSQNALKHGAYAQPGLLLANEEPAIFNSFRDAFYANFRTRPSCQSHHLPGRRLQLPRFPLPCRDPFSPPILPPPRRSFPRPSVLR